MSCALRSARVSTLPTTVFNGTTRAVSSGRIFAQEQIARAAELSIGVGRPELIDLVTDDAAGQAFLGPLRPVRSAG